MRLALRRWGFAFFLPAQMARESKRIELKQVEDKVVEKSSTYIRLESEGADSRQHTPITILDVQKESKVVQRLQVSTKEDAKNRSFEPDIDVLIDSLDEPAPELEQAWGEKSLTPQPVPWGWFVLLGLILSGAILWSLGRVNHAEDQAVKIEETTKSIFTEDDTQEREAEALVDTIEKTIKQFVESPTIDQRLKLSRHPERVGPLMGKFYDDRQTPNLSEPVAMIDALQPVTLDNVASFWMASIHLKNNQKKNLILEVMPSGAIGIDWETFVNYQPMKWDDFATQRPKGTSLDFRVYVESDNFFSHEFANARRWNSFRLTALDSEEVVFGYSEVDNETSKALLAMISQSGSERVPVILRLAIPDGLQSRQGVIIEKLICNRWIFVNDPSRVSSSNQILSD